jgi:hypothetical protein
MRSGRSNSNPHGGPATSVRARRSSRRPAATRVEILACGVVVVLHRDAADVTIGAAAGAPGSFSRNPGSTGPSNTAAAARSTRVARSGEGQRARSIDGIARADDPLGGPGATLTALGPVHRLREVARLDRSRLAFAAAVPGAIGYAVPLLVGLATAHVADGVTASAGALIVGSPTWAVVTGFGRRPCWQRQQPPVWRRCPVA